MNKPLAIFLIILGLTAAIVWGYPKVFKSLEGSPTNPTGTPVTRVIVPDGWKQYKNEELGFSFAVPENFTVEKNGGYSVMAKHPDAQTKVGDIEFFYVSVVPQSLYENETGEVYNYQKTFHERLLGIPIGEIRHVGELEGQKDWYMYERMGNETINGGVAKVFLNQKPWEFPAGMWEYRYIFDLKNKIVLAGGYIVGGPSDTPLSLPVFQKIIGSLVLFD
jgi:hypothetical protein